MSNVDLRIELWKKRLLDLGKRNRLINYKETKRSNLKVVMPELSELYRRLVNDEEALTFPRPKSVTYDDDDESTSVDFIDGDIHTDRSLKEQQKTLHVLRDRAKTAIEEQGVNILYLSFGFLQWKESSDSDQTLMSPIVLVPVTITIESLNSPYVLSLHEDEIVINPTLLYKLDNDFGIVLPEFDSANEDIEQYLSSIQTLVSDSGWTVKNNVGVSLLSFLKINMYTDLSNNSERLNDNPLIRALSGDASEIRSLPEEFNNYDHDTNTRPIDVYQVVDADSSQQDAVLFSKKGISFILQGPPGTGKSQTITNIIGSTPVFVENRYSKWVWDSQIQFASNEINHG